jgi:hypothetical protein
MTTQTLCVYLMSTGSVTLPTPRFWVRLNDTAPVKGIRLRLRARHEPRAVGPLLKILPNLVHNDRSDETPYHARTRPLFRRGSGNIEKAATAASELE